MLKFAIRNRLGLECIQLENWNFVSDDQPDKNEEDEIMEDGFNLYFHETESLNVKYIFMNCSFDFMKKFTIMQVAS